MPTVKLGQIVKYHSGHDDTQNAFYVPAIVTMTVADWQPGYRTADGEWQPMTDHVQPKPGTVHLHAFFPQSTGTQLTEKDYLHVPYGTTYGNYSEI